MTEPREGEPFETRFARLARAYTDIAAERAIDPTEMSHAAIAAHAIATSLPRPTGRVGGGRVRSVGWAGAIVALTLVGVVGAAILGRPSDVINEPSSSPSASPGGPIPEVLRRAWGRQLPLSNLESRPPGFLRLTRASLSTLSLCRERTRREPRSWQTARTG